MMNRVLPDIRPVPVPLDDIIHRVPYPIPFLPYVAPHGGKEALGWWKDGRWMCYYHPGDIGDAWADEHAGVAGKAAQFTFTSGPPRRGLLAWMASAISSFPVPLSPRIRTVASVGATIARVSKIP